MRYLTEVEFKLRRSINRTLFDSKTLFEGKVDKSILIRSFDDYKKQGGKHDVLDTYAFLKERAKEEESNYISAMDQCLSGIPVPKEYLDKQLLIAQALWHTIHLWFNKPLREVSYTAFDINEFNKL